MKTIWSFLFACAFASVAAAHEGCDEHEHEHEHLEHEHEHHAHEYHEHDHAHGPSVTIAPAVQRTLGLTTVRPEKRRLAGSVVLTGRYELAPEARRALVSPVAGRLSLKVKTFDRVAEGDVLFTVSAPDLVSSADEIALLEKRLAVYRELKTPNAALENELAVKKASRAALLSGADEERGVVTIRATLSGVVEALPATDGAWLETGTEVVRLVKPEALRLKALVSPAEIGRLADGLSCTAEGAAGELRIGLDAEAGLIPVYAVFPNATPKGRVGARGSFICETDRDLPESVCVPRAAIVRIGLQPTVFVRDEDDATRFVAIDVTPGETVGGWTAVTGLPDDDDLEVVVDGAYEMKLALAADSAVRPTGHFHADGTFHEGED